jgi:hypothetical protein
MSKPYGGSSDEYWVRNNPTILPLDGVLIHPAQVKALISKEWGRLLSTPGNL